MLEELIEEKSRKIDGLKMQIRRELEDAFMERHGLREGQRFLLNGKECEGVECEDDGLIRTFRVTQEGRLSMRPTVVRKNDKVEAIKQ